MNEKEKVFLNTIDDLKRRLEKCSQYDLLRASGLLRQLLIDNNSLVNQVNKTYKLKITYRVQKRFEWPESETLPDGTKPKTLYSMVFILPSENSSDIENLKISDFFKYKLLFNGDQGFTVLDIIKICAHKYGGIHLEDIKDQKDSSLDSLHNCFKFNDSSSILQALHSIIKICLIALQPLEEAIKV